MRAIAASLTVGLVLTFGSASAGASVEPTVVAQSEVQTPAPVFVGDPLTYPSASDFRYPAILLVPLVLLVLGGMLARSLIHPIPRRRPSG